MKTFIETELEVEHVDEPQDEPGPDDGPEVWLPYLGDRCRAVRLYRRDLRGGKYEYLDSLGPEDFSEPGIKETWGGGDFQARFCDLEGRYLKQITFKIAGPRKAAPEPSSPAEAAIDGRLARLEQLIEKQGHRAEHGGGTAGDMMASAVALATSMQTAQTTLLVPLLEALASRDAGGGGGLQDMDAMFSIMERMQDMAAERLGNQDIITSLGLPLLGQIQKLAEQEKSGNPPALGGEATDAPAPLAPGGLPAPGWVTALRPYVAELTQLAKFHGDPVYWARAILGRASDAEFLFMEEQAGLEGFPDEFHAWFPDTVQHRPWFARFWEEMVEAVAELRAGDDDSEPAEQEEDDLG